MGIHSVSKRNGRVGSKKRRRYQRFWGKLCVDLYQTMLTFARRLANGNEDRAKVLVQTAVGRALEYCRKPTEIKNHKAYLLQAVRNEWIRARPKVVEVGFDEITETEIKASVLGEPESALRDIEVRASVEALIRKAGIDSPEFDRMFNLIFVQGLTLKQTAAELGQTVERTRSRWYGYRALLRNELKKESRRSQAKSKITLAAGRVR